MHKPVRDLQMNFEPPSDFVGETSGRRRWAKWLGIGCAGISLIIALIMVFGGFKMVSCCSDLMETGKMTIAVEGFSQEFARAVQKRDFEAAYAMTSVEDYQSKTSLEAFTAPFLAHEAILAESMPVVLNLQVLGTGNEEGPNWDVTLRMLPPDGDQMLTMVLSVGGVAAAEKEGTPEFRVYNVQLETRKRDLSAEAPAVGAVEFQNMLRRGDYEAAYAQFGREVLPGESADADAMSEEAFKLFVKENEAVLTLEVVEVVRVEYIDSNEARIVLRVGAGGQASSSVRYTMARLSVYGGWKVLEISPQALMDDLSGAADDDSAENVQDPEAENGAE